MADCVYVTDGWCIHDDRWTSALRTLGHDPAVISMGREINNPQSLREHVSQAANGNPVLAGPLGSIARHLVDGPYRLVGLSWGFDLHDLQADDDLSWLGGLDALIVDSESTKGIAVAAGMPPASISQLPWGIELASFLQPTSSLTAADLGLPDDAEIIVTLRAHEPRYRVGDVIEAFPAILDAVPRAALVVGHSGSLTEALKERAAALGIAARVAFIGTIAEAQLPPLLHAAACYVSTSEVDGTSVTLLQAMAAGTPVVVSDIPGNRGWVTPGETGSLYPIGDPTALSQAIIAALAARNAQRIAQEVERARALVVREADWSQNIERLEQALFPMNAKGK